MDSLSNVWETSENDTSRIKALILLADEMKNIGDSATQGIKSAEESSLSYDKMVGGIVATTQLSQKQIEGSFNSFRMETNKSLSQAQDDFGVVMNSFKTFGKDAPKHIKAFTKTFTIVESLGGDVGEVPRSLHLLYVVDDQDRIDPVRKARVGDRVIEAARQSAWVQLRPGP